MKKSIVLLILSIIYANVLFSQYISRIEPLSWWVGMKTPLQLMIYGENLKDASIVSMNSKIIIEAVHNADSPNYLFLDISIDPSLEPGYYKFILIKGEKEIPFNYAFDKRREGSAIRKSFGPQDIVYLLMPDRFANGNARNDNHPDASERADRSANYGRHGGDIDGLIGSLDYLSELGITAIWSTPLLFDNEPESSYHGYACADYYRIDPRFGSNEQYRNFVKEANERGIKIIMDMVPNHSGMAHWWMKDLPFHDWLHMFPQYTQSNFAMSTHSDIHSSKIDNERCVEGWFDRSMPDMNLNQPFLLKYFLQNAIWWVEWANLSGIRVDTFPYSDKYAAAEWTSNIRKEYPNISIVGECLFLSPQEVSYWEGDADNRDGYRSNLTNIMDFPLQDAIHSGLVKDSVPQWGEGFYKIYKSLSLDFAYKHPNNLMIFADNHDTHRVSEMLNKDSKKVKMALTLLATMRGIPQIYYGTEIMLSTKDGKLGHGEERLDMPGGWTGDSKSVFNGKGLSCEEQDILNYAKKLFNWRKDKSVVHFGQMTHYWPENNLYVFFRNLDDKLIMVLINNHTNSQTIDWKRFSESIGGKTTGEDVISGEMIRVGSAKKIAAQSSMIVEFD